jgi:hypothetical protein
MLPDVSAAVDVDVDATTPAAATAAPIELALFTITPGAATATLTITTVLLVLSHIVVVGIGPGSDIDSVTGLGRILHLNGEKNAPALFATALLLAAALAFALWARAAIGGTRARRMWQLLAALFVFLAVDEYFSVHERLSEPIRTMFDLHGTAFHYAWILPYGIGVAALAAMFLPIYLRLPRRTQFGFGLAAALFLTGAFGMQVVGSLVLASHGDDSTFYAVASTVEETLELAGVVVLIDTLLRGLAALPRGARLQLAPGRR